MTFQHFPIQMYGAQIWPCSKNVKCQSTTIIWTTTYDHHLNKFDRPWVPNAIYQGSASKLSWFWRWRFLSVLSIYGHCSMARNHLNELSIPIWQKAPCEIRSKFLKRFQRKRHSKLHNFLYVYSLEAREDNPQGAEVWLWLKSFTTFIINCNFH